MGRYRKIAIQMWGDRDFQELSPIQPSAQGLWLYLLTGPHTGPVPGLFRAGRASLAESLNWPLEAFDEAFREVLSKGMAIADQEAKLIWLPKALKHNKPESPNVVKSWKNELDLLPECDLKDQAINSMVEFMQMLGPSYVAALQSISITPSRKPSRKPSVKPKTKAMPNQEQEQEQEQINIVAFSDPQKNTPQAPAVMVKKSDLEIAVFKVFWDCLITAGGLELTPADRKVQAKQCWALVNRTTTQFPGTASQDAAKSIVDAFLTLKESDRTSGGFWRQQPRTPMALSSQAVWGQVLESMRHNRKAESSGELLAGLV